MEFKIPESKESQQIAMSADPKSTFKPNATHGEFWQGYMLDKWFYTFLVWFPITGFLGIDQLALRSPFTAVIKLLVNIFFLGAWYFYDIVQITVDKDFVAKYGFSTPYGVSGHGYRMLHNLSEQKIDEFSEPSPYNSGLVGTVLYLFYAFLTLFLGFTGFNAMLAGDFNGGIIKLFSNFLILPFFFYVFSQILEFFKVGSVQKDGISHPWPLFPMLTIFEKFPAINLMGEEKAKGELAAHLKKYDAQIKANESPQIPALLKDLFKKAYEAANNIPVVAAFNTVSAAKGAALATSDMAQSAVRVAQKVATAAEQRISQNPNAILDKILGPATPSGTPAAAATAAKEGAAAAANPIPSQTGGAQEFLSPEFDNVMLMGMGVLILGGFAAALIRKFTLPRRQEDDEYPRKVYERDDAPPNPGRV